MRHEPSNVGDVSHAIVKTSVTLTTGAARTGEVAQEIMSRAFVNEDADGAGPRRDYHLPERDDPDFDAAAARVLLEAARAGETAQAEDATGYRWGEPTLASHVRRILKSAEAEGDDRLEQLARRFLR